MENRKTSLELRKRGGFEEWKRWLGWIRRRLLILGWISLGEQLHNRPKIGFNIS
jgi:hypothetical protein